MVVGQRQRGCDREAVDHSPSPQWRYLFTVVATRANGARTSVRRNVGWRRGLAISQRGSAVPTFLRDKSRAPSQFLVATVNTYQGRGPGTECGPSHGPINRSEER